MFHNFHPNVFGGAAIAFVVVVPFAWALLLVWAVAVDPMLQFLGL